MSARQRNRLNKLKESQAEQSDPSSDEGSEDDFLGKPSANKAFGFQMMGAMDDTDESDSEADSDKPASSLMGESDAERPEEDPTVESQEDRLPASYQNTVLPPSPPNSKSEKDPAPSKKKQAQQINLKNGQEEDLDVLLAEMNLSPNRHSGGPQDENSSASASLQGPDLLAPDPRHQENEIKRKFGSAAILAEAEEKKTQGIRRRRGGRVVVVSGAQQQPRHRKKCLLGQGKPTWPPPVSAVAGGVGMRGTQI